MAFLLGQFTSLEISRTSKPNIKFHLQTRIGAALQQQGSYLPFNDPCKTEKDGVYIFCSDFHCAEWISNVVKEGIPTVDGLLTVLPQDTPLNYKPEFTMVRTVTCIPSRKPKNKIVEFFAKMSRNINTERWKIGDSRPKGSHSSTVYIKMDKKSFEIIQANDNKLNWILGPVEVHLEEHRPKTKRSGAASAAKKAAATANSKAVENHRKQPSLRSVECKASLGYQGSPKNGESGPKGWKSKLK